MRHTRTHTVFFGEEELAELRAAVEKLGEDWRSRSSHIDDELSQRGEARLSNLRIAVNLLAEPAD